MTPIPRDDQLIDLFQTPHVDAVVMTVDLVLDGTKGIFGCVMPDMNVWIDNIYWGYLNCI